LQYDNLHSCITWINKFRGTGILIMNYADNSTAKFRGRERSMRCASLADSKCHYYCGARARARDASNRDGWNNGWIMFGSRCRRHRGNADLFYCRVILWWITEHRAYQRNLCYITKCRCDEPHKSRCSQGVLQTFVSDLINIAGI